MAYKSFCFKSKLGKLKDLQSMRRFESVETVRSDMKSKVRLI